MRVSFPLSVVSKLRESIFVEPEVVGELVQDGDPDFLPQLDGIGKRLLERQAVDRDRVGRHARHVAPLCERDAVVETKQIGIVRVLVLDDHRDVLESGGEMRRELVERRAHVILEGHLITSAISAFWVCRRFSACSQARQRGPYRTSAAISSPTCAGKQCIATASASANARRSASMRYGS